MTQLILIAVRKETEQIYGGMLAHRGLDRRDADALFELYEIEDTCTRVAIVAVDDEHVEVVRERSFPERMTTPLDEAGARQLDSMSNPSIPWFHNTFWPGCKDVPCPHQPKE